MRRLPLSILLCALAGCASAPPGVHTADRAQSVTHFCQAQNADRLGRPGEAEAGSCVVERNAAFPRAHADGPGLHERAAALHHLRKKLLHSQERARSIEDALAEAKALLSVPDLAPAQRATLAIEVEQLTEQRIELARAIDQLERHHAAAAREYDAQRSRMASHRS
jgi:hypothetical protein